MPLIVHDKSPRTGMIIRPAIAMVIAVVLLVGGALAWGVQEYRFSSLVAKSSTPIGSTLTFSQSKAKLTLSGIYTNNNHEALVVRFTPEDNAASTLIPYRGKDFTVFSQSDAYPKDIRTVSTLFGRMGTDGDYFLILPRPTGKVYTYMIVNNTYTLTAGLQNQDSADTAGTSSNLDQLSVTKALSEFGTMSMEDKGKEGANTVGSSLPADVMSFQVTIDPASDDAKYQPTVIATSLLSGGQFRFDVLFNNLLKNSAVKQLTEQYNQLQQQITALTMQIRNLQEQVRYNSQDTVASAQLESVTSDRKKLQKKQDKVVTTITKYEGLDYDDSFFQNFQTQAIVLHAN